MNRENLLELVLGAILFIEVYMYGYRFDACKHALSQ